MLWRSGDDWVSVSSAVLCLKIVSSQLLLLLLGPPAAQSPRLKARQPSEEHCMSKRVLVVGRLSNSDAPCGCVYSLRWKTAPSTEAWDRNTGLLYDVGIEIGPILFRAEVLKFYRLKEWIKFIYSTNIYWLLIRCQSLGQVPETDMVPIIIKLSFLRGFVKWRWNMDCAFLYFMNVNRNIQFFLSQASVLFILHLELLLYRRDSLLLRPKVQCILIHLRVCCVHCNSPSCYVLSPLRGTIVMCWDI